MEDSERGHGFKSWVYILLVAISAGFLVGGYYAGRESLLAHLLDELGVAGLVAFALAFTIERLSAEEFNRRAKRERTALRKAFEDLAKQERDAIKRDVFHQAYGSVLPPEIRDELEHQVLQSDFIRSGLYLQFELTIQKDPLTSEEYVRSKCLTKSRIANICGEAKIFPIEHSIRRSPSDALKDEVKYLEFQASGSETEFSLNESDLKTMTRSDEAEISLDLSRDREQRVVKVLPDRPTTLRIQYQGIRMKHGGYIYFSFTSHTCDLELTVHVKNCDLEVLAEAYSPHPLVKTDRHDPDNGYYNWTLEKPLLCYQGVNVTWKDRPPRLSQQPLQTDIAAEIPPPQGPAVARPS